MAADKVLRTQEVAESLAMAYEREQGRKPLIVGHATRGLDIKTLVTEALEAAGHDSELLWSFDILSMGVGGPRFIEVKGRGGVGPVPPLPDREYDTAARLGTDAWLYVVYGCSGDAQQLYVINDWSTLPWVRDREPRPEMLVDQTLGSPFRDRRSRSQRLLDAEGRWTLPTDVVRKQLEMVFKTRAC